MVDIFEKAQQAIIRHKLLAKGDRVLIALSGGPDSVALLHFLHSLKTQCQLNIAAAHLDHAIRPKSAKDLDFCRGLCQNLKIKFYSKRLNIPLLAKRKGFSLEEAGREARYAYFDSLADKYRYNKIATGHTLDDNVETVLLNLTRGSGLEGLSGIPRRRGRIIRPFLGIEKNELFEWLRAQKIKYVHDITNRSLSYSRNRIRLKVLPELEKINPAARQNIVRLSEIVVEELEYLSGQTVSAYEEALIESGKSKIVLDLGKLEPYDKSLRKKVLKEAFRKLNGETGNLSSQAISRALSIVEGESGKKAPLGKGIFIEKSQGRIAILKIPIRPEKLKLQIPGKTELPANQGYIETKIIQRNKIADFDRGNYIVYLDMGKMSNIGVRYWQNSDKIRPLGMDGHRLLSDIFIDRKIPEYERELIPLLFSGTELAWIAGVMISENFKITEKTQEVLNLRYVCLDY